METLNPNQIIELVKKITYKPEWKIDAWHNEFDPDIVSIRVITAPVVDVDHYPTFQEKTTIQNYGGIPIKSTRNAVLARVREMIHTLETHEADEWLKIDGEFVNDPHPGRKPPPRLDLSDSSDSLRFAMTPMKPEFMTEYQQAFWKRYVPTFFGGGV